MRIITLSENTAGRMGLLAEWGISILIEIDNLKILLDTGASTPVVYNAPLLGVDLSTIDKIVLSHGHSDHTGGLREVLLSRGGKKVEVIAHPGIWAPKFWVSPCTRRLEEGSYNYVGIPYRREELEDLGASFNLTKEPTWITDNIVVAGEIPMITEYEEIESGLYIKENSEFRPDPLLDDRAIFIKTEKGLVVILGCCHRGIINTIHCAQELTGVRDIYAIIGGTHLALASEDRLKITIDKLKEFDIERLGCSHCTGLPVSARLAQEFGNKFFFNNAGTIIEI